MEDLLKPDYGVLVLTICNFLLLVFLLKKFAWKPIIHALESREKQIEADKQSAQQAREQAESIKRELDQKLAQISEEASGITGCRGLSGEHIKLCAEGARRQLKLSGKWTEMRIPSFLYGAVLM